MQTGFRTPTHLELISEPLPISPVPTEEMSSGRSLSSSPPLVLSDEEKEKAPVLGSVLLKGEELDSPLSSVSETNSVEQDVRPLFVAVFLLQLC